MMKQVPIEYDASRKSGVELERLESLILAGTIWGNVLEYLGDRGCHVPHVNEAAERRSARWVLDSDAYIVALLILHNELLQVCPMTVRGLAKAMASPGETYLKAMAQRIKRIAREGEHFGLFLRVEDLHEVTRQRCVRVIPTNTLRQYFADEIYPRLPHARFVETNR